MTTARRPGSFVRLPGGLAPLGYRNFALYWLGFASTNAGKWIENTGAVWVAYELTGNPFLLGLMGVIRALPTILVTPFAGVLVDRVDQRRLIMVTQAIMLVTSLLTGLLILEGRIELWQLYLEVFIQSAVLSVDYIARQALFPRLVPRDHMVESVTLTSTAARISGLVGPAVGGFAIAGFGDAAPFLLNAATFLVLMGALAGIKGVAWSVGVAVRTTWRAELIEGWRYLLATPVLLGLLQLEVVYGVFQMNPVLITIVGRETLGVGPEGLGGLLSATSVGAIVGTGLLLAFGTTARPGRFVTLAAIACAAALIGFAFTRDYVTAFAVLMVAGVFDAMVSVTRSTIAQLAAPGHMRGRIMANQGVVVRGFGPLAQTQSGVTAGLFGGPMAVLVSSLALGLSAALVARRNRPFWHMARDDDPDGDESAAPASG